MKRINQVGIDRLIRLEWLEKTANLALGGSDSQYIKESLEYYLAPHFQSPTTERRGSLSKTMTILMKTWVRAPEECKDLHNAAIQLLADRPKQQHLPIHWGMLMAAYPFWGSVAAQTGRLLRLQGTVAANQAQRRIREQYGQRETVSRRVRYVLRAFVDWGVLEETESKGIYTRGIHLSVGDPELTSWLVEAFLHTRTNGSVALSEVLNSPSFFPFRLKQMSGAELVSHSPRMELLRHGLNEEMILLKD